MPNNNTQSRRHHIGLRIKMFFVINTIVILMAICGVFIGRFFVKVLVQANFYDIGSTAIEVLTTQLDNDRLEDYFDMYKNGEEFSEDYLRFQQLVTDVAAMDEDIEYLYVIMPKDDAVYYVFDSSVGLDKVFSSIEYGDPTVPSKDEMMSGQELTKDMTTGAYGSLYTIWTPLRDSSGNTVAYFGADIKVEMLDENTKDLTTMMLIAFAFIAVIVSLFFVISTDKQVVQPIVKLNKAAFELTQSMDHSDVDDEDSKLITETRYFDKLKINSSDEIGDLHHSLIRMEQANHDYQVGMLKATSEKERLSTELNIASQIQEGMLPGIVPNFDSHEEYEMAALMRPAKEVGGDFYDFFYIDQDHLALVIADVSGKGVPAALFMMISMIMIKQQAQREGTPSQILEIVNDQLCDNNPNNMFVTVWLGIIDLNTGHVIASNGGHEYPLLADANGEYHIFEDEHSIFLGGMPGVKYIDYEFDIPKGGSLFVYTDGVPEAKNLDEEFFEIKGIERKLNESHPATPALTVEEMIHAVDAFAGECEQFDDITMLSFKYKGRTNSTEQ